MELQNEVSGMDVETVKETEGKYLTFWTSEQLFAISISNVEQIVKMQDITSVPDYPMYAKGIVSLRNRIIPVIDMRLRLNKPENEYTERTCIIITKVHEDLFGFIVDEVDEVMDIADSQISMPPLMGGDATSEYLYGVARIQGGEAEKLILLLDITKILPEQVFEELARAAH